MCVRAHLVGNPAFLQAVPGEPGVGALDRALDMIARLGRSHKAIPPADIMAAHEIFDTRVDVFQFADQLPRNQERQRMQRICDRASRS